MREYISARYLLAEPPGPTVVPGGFPIQRYPARVAQGARKPRFAPRGDAPSVGHAARTTAQVFDTADRRETRNLAARGW